MLKWIAVIAMLIDHIGHYLGFLMPYDVMLGLRIIGRLAFPIFAYSIALGCLRTGNIKKYGMKMFVFAILTQGFWLGIGKIYSVPPLFYNVLFTFSFSIGIIFCLNFLQNQYSAINAKILIPTNIVIVKMLGAFLGVGLCLVATLILKPDYSLYGVCSVLWFYFILKTKGNLLGKRLNPLAIFLMFGGFFLITFLYVWQNVSFDFPRLSLGNSIQLFAVVSVLLFPLASFQAPKPGKFSQNFFYIFYPVHIGILMILQSILRI